MTQLEKADLFRALHSGPKAFVLPNCWDAASARMLEAAGFPAVATASAAISWAHAVPDGEHLSRDQLVSAVATIARAISLPLTADIEKGFGEGPEDVADTVARILDAGAVGINIEDGLADGSQLAVEQMQARIAAARQAGERAGIPLVINARVDAYLQGRSGEEVFRDSVARAAAWFAAGADCVFLPGVTEPDLIGHLAAALEGPMNVIVMGADTLPVAELERLGVRRISTGPRLMQATLGALSGFARSISEHGDFRFLEGAPSFADINGLFQQQ